MGIDPGQLRRLIIRPVLLHLDAHSRAAENLLLGTAAQESHLGEYLAQIGGGPARGIFQMEPATRRDIDQYLRRKSRLRLKVEYFKLPALPAQLYGNLYYAAAMCRIHYWRVTESLPRADDIEGLAAYWKRYYNTPLGHGTITQFLFNYSRFIKTS